MAGVGASNVTPRHICVRWPEIFSLGRPQGEFVSRSVAARSEIHEMTATILFVTVVTVVSIKCFQGDIVTVDPLTIPMNLRTRNLHECFHQKIQAIHLLRNTRHM